MVVELVVTLTILEGNIKMINFEKIRSNSLKTAKKLGYKTNIHLPLLEESNILKSKEEILGRVCLLHALVGCSYGFPVDNAKNWLEKEKLVAYLTEKERTLFSEVSIKDDFVAYRTKVESIWTLCWVLQKVHVFDFRKLCSDSLVKLLPDLKTGESVTKFSENIELRKAKSVIANCDLAYCLHWAIVDSHINNKDLKLHVAPYVIIERRHALEWLLSKDDWDSVTLDT